MPLGTKTTRFFQHGWSWPGTAFWAAPSAIRYRTRRRGGALWEGRFRFWLTQTADYVLAYYLYIKLNPVRAGMAVRPQCYRGSSYHANAQGKANSLFVLHDEMKTKPSEVIAIAILL
jgi:hypothetical protein